MKRSKFIPEGAVVFEKRLGQYVRKGSGDHFIVKEQKYYEPLTQLDLAGEIVLDLGAHIGCFERYMRKHSNAEAFTAVEPDPNNLRVLRRNLKTQDHIIEGAVVDIDWKSPTVKLYLGKTYSSGNSLEPFRGRQTIEVAVIQWSRLLKEEPKLIKCDIEGGEYQLNFSIVPTSVKGIGMEYHFFRHDWLDKAIVIHNTLIGVGFKPTAPLKPDMYRRACMCMYLRD